MIVIIQTLCILNIIYVLYYYCDNFYLHLDIKKLEGNMLESRSGRVV